MLLGIWGPYCGTLWKGENDRQTEADREGLGMPALQARLLGHMPMF